MAKAITKEEILGMTKKHEETWIREKINRYVIDIRKQAGGELYEIPTTGLIWTDWIPKRYMHLEKVLYSEVKERFPDSRVIVSIQEVRWMFCFKYTQLKTQISWQ